MSLYFGGFMDAAAGEGRLTKKTFTTHKWMHTCNELTLFADFSTQERLDAARGCWAWIEAFLEKVDRSIALSRPKSDISRFNAAAPGAWSDVSSRTAAMVCSAVGFSHKTNGFFDPTTSYLTDLWGFSPRTYAAQYTPSMWYDRPRGKDGALPPPAEGDVALLLKTCGVAQVSLEDRAGRHGLKKDASRCDYDGGEMPVRLDLGGVAKGWVADAVLETVNKYGFQYASYSCESSLAVSKSASSLALQRGDRSYTVDLARPRYKPGYPHFAQVKVHDRCIATSGDYGRGYSRNGVLFSHIISPFTGLPLNVTNDMAYGGQTHQRGLCTVTLIGPSAAEADATATALCLMGPWGAVDFFNEVLFDEGWDIVAVEYDNGRPGCLGVATSLRAPDFRLLDVDAQVLEGRVRMRG